MRNQSAKELEKLMEHDGYRRFRGVVKQTRHAPSVFEGMPNHCYGCAWVDSFGGCMVFVDAWNAWISGDYCEAYATDEERDAVESAICQYARQRYRTHVQKHGEVAGQIDSVETAPGV